MTLKTYIKRGAALLLAAAISLGVFVAYLFVTPIYEFKRARLYAQAIFELSCPLGTSSVQSLQSLNQSTGKYRQNWCVDINGNVTTSFGASTTIISFIQTAIVDNPSTPATTWSIAFPANNLAGSLLVFAHRDTGTTFSISDSQGNNWQQSSNNQFWYALNCKGGPNTFTLTYTSSSIAQYGLAEYSGVSPTAAPDQQSFNGTPSGTNWGTAPVTTTANGELLIGWGFNVNTNSPLYTAGAGYTLRTGGRVPFIEDSLQQLAGPASATLVTPGYNGNIGFISFKNAVGNTSPAAVSNTAFSGACVGKNCFLPQNYAGYFGDTIEVLNGTWSASGTSITIGSALFAASDNGKLCWGSPQSNQTGPATPGTFTFISATTGTCGPSGSLVGSAASNGMFTWGHDDTPAFIAATAALYSQPKCGSLVLPAARVMINQGLSFTGVAAADCNINIIGSGYASVIVMEPGFGFGTVTNSIGCTATGCWWNSGSTTTVYLYFTISAEFNSFNGASTLPATTLFTIPPGGYCIGVNLFAGVTATSTSPNSIGINGYAAFGLGCATNSFGNGNIVVQSGYGIGNNDGGANVTLTNAGGAQTIVDYAGTYTGVHNQGSTFSLYGTATNPNNGGFGSMSCDIGSTMNLDGAGVGTQGSVGTNGIGFAWNNLLGGNPCAVYAKFTKFIGGSSGSALNCASGITCDFFEGPGNTYTTPVIGGAGTLRWHHTEGGTCTFAAATTCAVTFTHPFGVTPTSVQITPINPGAVTFSINAAPTSTGFTITASGANSLAVQWSATLQ